MAKRISKSTARYRIKKNKQRLNVIASELKIFGTAQNILFENYLKNISTKKTFITIKKLEKNILDNNIGAAKRSLIAKLAPELQRQATTKEIRSLKEIRDVVAVIQRNEFYMKNKEAIQDYNDAVKSENEVMIAVKSEQLKNVYTQSGAKVIARVLTMKGKK